MNDFFRGNNARVRHAGWRSEWSALAQLGKLGRHIVCGYGTKHLLLVKVQNSESSLTEAGRIGQHGFEHWFKFTG